jgi:hypothetical protein
MRREDLFKFEVRYWVVWYDSQWQELPELALKCCTMEDVLYVLAQWHTENIELEMSGDILPLGGLARAQYVSVEASHVEAKKTASDGHKFSS